MEGASRGTLFVCPCWHRPSGEHTMTLPLTQKPLPHAAPQHDSDPCDLPDQQQTGQGRSHAQIEAGSDEREITEDDFFYALIAGDLHQAAVVLRTLGGVSGGAAELLADLLEGNPYQEDYFPYRFALSRWRPGRSTNRLQRGARRFLLRLKVSEKLKTEKKVHLAVAAVAVETKLRPSTVWSALSRDKN